MRRYIYILPSPKRSRATVNLERIRLDLKPCSVGTARTSGLQHAVARLAATMDLDFFLAYLALAGPG